MTAELVDGERTLRRYGYINSRSSAGQGLWTTVLIEDVVAVRGWVNSWGNPSFTYRMRDGAHAHTSSRMSRNSWILASRPEGENPGGENPWTLYLVDDYGGSNDIRVRVDWVARKKDLFVGWVR